MNYHYIDYMIKERQKEALEESERKRVLISAGYTQAGLIHKICGGIVNAVHRLRKQRSATSRLLYPCCSIAKGFVRTRGEAR